MKQDTFFVIILVLLFSIVVYLLKTNKPTNRNHAVHKQHKPSRFLEKVKEVFDNVAGNLSSNIYINDKGDVLSENTKNKQFQQKEYELNKQRYSQVKDFCEVESGIKPPKVLKTKSLDDKINITKKCYHLLVDDLYFDKNQNTKDPLNKKAFNMRQEKKAELEKDFQALIKKIRTFEEENKKKSLPKKDCPCEDEVENNEVVASNETDNNYEKNLEDYMRLVRLKNIAKTY